MLDFWIMQALQSLKQGPPNLINALISKQLRACISTSIGLLRHKFLGV